MKLSETKHKFLKQIKKICYSVSIIDDEDLVIKHSSDWRGRFSNRAFCVSFPKNVSEASKLMRFCHSNRIKVIPQGGNTGLVCGTMPRTDKNELIINFQKMNKIMNIDHINQYVTAESGTIISNLITQCKNQKLVFPLTGLLHFKSTVTTTGSDALRSSQ